MQGFSVSARNGIFQAGIGINAVEARVRQIESLMAQIEAQSGLRLDETPSNATFRALLDAQAQAKTQPTASSQPGNTDAVASPYTLPSPPYPTMGEVNRVDTPSVPSGLLKPTLPLNTRREQLSPLIRQLSQHHGVDEALIHAVVKQESGYQPAVVSHAGARGLMQLMPATARDLGVNDATDPQQNLDGGIRYLKQQLKRFNGNVALALAAYNAGPAAVEKHGGIPPYPETRQYVRTILADYLRSRQSSTA